MNPIEVCSTSIKHLRAQGGPAAVMATALLRAMAAQPGDVDPNFVPADNNFGLTAFQAGDRLYAPDGGQTIRYLPNGERDPSWNGAAGQRTFARGEVEFPDGRLLLGDFGIRPAIFAPNGELLFVNPGPSGGFPDFPQSTYPRPDGSVVYFRGNRSGPWPESVDQNLSHPVFLPAVPPWEAGGLQEKSSITISPGTPSFTTIRDTSGRFIVAGNISSADGLQRRGLLRLLSDGSLDQAWNPGPALGLGQTLNEASIFNGIPINLIACTNDEIEVVLRFPDKPDGQRIVFARIRGDGSIARTLPVVASEHVRGYALAAQLDGRFFVGGSFTSSFTNWNGQPATSLVRLNADGLPDPTFQVVLKGAAPEVTIRNMGIQSDGYLWISGDFTSVNGVSRPGLARVFAYAPPPSPPRLTLERYPARVGTNEFLFVSAKVEGFPQPNLQWLSNGIPISGATFRGLRLAMDGSGLVPNLEIVASNAVDVVRLAIPPIQSARRTPLPGTRDAAATVELPGINTVTSWLGLPGGGSVLAGTLSFTTLTSSLTDTEHTMLIGLDTEWHLDASFGNGGVLNGNGSIEKLLLEPDGRVWVLGHFTKFAGQTVAGCVLLDRRGQIIEAPWPALDNPHLTAGLKLPGGKRLLAGIFNQVNDQPAYRLVRLDATGQVDTSFTSPLNQGQLVDDLQMDGEGRVLAAGARSTSDSAIGFRVRRLKANGAWDATFQEIPSTYTIFPNYILGLQALPKGRWLLQNPPMVLGPDGAVERALQAGDGFGGSIRLVPQPQASARVGPDGMIYALYERLIYDRILRWFPTGEFDFDYYATTQRQINAQTLLRSRGSLFVFGSKGELAVFASPVLLPNPETPEVSVSGILIFPDDADRRLRIQHAGAGQVQVVLPTLPQKSYRVGTSSGVTPEAPQTFTYLEGDGYEQTITSPAQSPEEYFRLAPR